MSVLDFIRKPNQQSTAQVPGQSVSSSSQSVIEPQGTVQTTTTTVTTNQTQPTDPQEIARQQYIAGLLKKQQEIQSQKAAANGQTQAVTQTPNQVQAPVATQSKAPPIDPNATKTDAVVPPVGANAQVPKNGQQPVQQANPQAPKDPNAKDETGAKGVVGADGGEMTRQRLLEIMTHLTQRSNRVLLASQVKAREYMAESVDSEHLLAGLITDSEIIKLLAEFKVEPAKVEAELAPLYRKGNTKVTPQLSPRFKKIIENSLLNAKKNGLEYISPEHILLSLFEEGEGTGARVLAKLGITLQDLQKKINTQVTAQNQQAVGPDGKPLKAGEAKKSALADFTIDITAKAERGELDQCVERSEEIERVVHVLSRRTKNNPALVGEPGVGKTSIVEGLAQRITAHQVPDVLTGKRILQLDLMAVLAGASHRGEFEQRMKDLIEEVVASNGQYVMFIDEMHTIVGAGGTGDGSMDAANFLKPALARGDLQMIGATTLTEYRKYIEKDPALERRFQTVMIPEPTEEQAIKMLKALRAKYENYHKVKIPDDAIDAAVKLSKRYVGDRFLPDKAIDLMDESAAAVRLPLMSLPEQITSLETRITQLNADKAAALAKNDTVRAKVVGNKIADLEPKLKAMKDDYEHKKTLSNVNVTEDIVKDVVSRWTGVPVSKMSGSETDKLAKLEQIMHERMIGQERAVTAVAAAVRRGRAGLKSNKRPIGSFIFLGPTGVGKTELTKTLAEVLFGQEDSMIRFDMTEFMEKHEVAKLLGPPPGYVGYEEGGKLTEAVRRKPYSVVLFDEVEKAHPDIFNILLQILDDGRLTDNKGRTISFKNTVVICTSNIGTQLIQDRLLKAQKSRLADDSGAKTETVDGTQKKEFKAGEQSDKKVAELDKKSREFTDMKDDDVAKEYKGAKPNFNEPELEEGFEYEDEAGGDLSNSQYNELKDVVMGELRKFFRPELINRFDEVIVFEPLMFKHMKKIVDLQLKALAKLLEEQNMGLTITDAAKEQIVIAGFDPVYGARPLRRAIQKLLENPISEMIIAKKAQDGDIIIVDFDGRDLVFKTEKPKEVVKMDDKKKSDETKINIAKSDKAEKYPMKAFVCAESGFAFKTAVYPNATIICPINAKEKVKEAEVKTDEKPKVETVDDKKTETVAPVVPNNVLNDAIQEAFMKSQQEANTFAAGQQQQVAAA
ncbi:MAG: AAA family ATPase [Patescibacteria group bacterium]